MVIIHSDLGVLVKAVISKVSQNTLEIDQSTLLLLMYLCDWHSCVKYGCRFTGIQWFVSKRGLSDLGLESYLRAHEDEFALDDVRKRVSVKGGVPIITNEYELSVINRVYELYEDRAWAGLVTFALSTYPIMSSSSDALEQIDLLSKAQDYISKK